MRIRTLSPREISALIDELRAMADLPAGTNAAALRRAKEIRQQIEAQPRHLPTSAEKVDEAFRGLEILLHPRRWREEPSLDFLRQRIKSACARLQHYEGLDP